MRPRRTKISVAVLALLTVAMLASAQVALAVFTDSVAGGSLSLITATLSPPKGVTSAQVNCRVNKNPEIEVTWSATSSTYATSYTIERATSSAGPYAVLASVAIPSTVYVDSSGSLNPASAYYYRVSAVYRSWSATSASASVKTLSKFCL